MGRQAGVSLVEASLLVALVGAVLAAFTPTFVRQLRLSRVAEASEQLAELHRGMAAYFETPQRDEEGNRRMRCLPGPAGPAPEQVGPDGVLSDFSASAMPGHVTWKALQFGPDYPSRYRYTVRYEAPALRQVETLGLTERLEHLAQGGTLADVSFDTAQEPASDEAKADALYTPGCARDEDDVTFVELTAEGDLDGDGQLSRFTRRARADHEGFRAEGGLVIADRME